MEQPQDDAKQTTKIGAGHLAAMARMGLKESAQVLPAFPESVRPVEELGAFGNPTQLDVNQEKGKESPYHQWLESRAKEVAAREQLPPDRAMER